MERSRRSWRPQFVHGEIALAELLFELFLGKTCAQLVDLGVHVRIHRQQAQFLGPLEHDLVVNENAKQLEFLVPDLLFAGLLRAEWGTGCDRTSPVRHR
jgi:hypothetical protein